MYVTENTPVNTSLLITTSTIIQVFSKDVSRSFVSYIYIFVGFFKKSEKWLHKYI